jgi:hypothetical protein
MAESDYDFQDECDDDFNDDDGRYDDDGIDEGNDWPEDEAEREQ